MSARKRAAVVVAVGALALLAAVLWPGAARQARSARVAAHEDRGAAEPVAHAPRVASATTLVSTAAPDRHPHPITAEHRRLYRDADLIDGAAGALRKHDVAQARVLLADHEREFGSKPGSDTQGLMLLADCIEQRDAASIERAQAFYDRHTHSMVRRQIRKQCLAPR